MALITDAHPGGPEKVAAFCAAIVGDHEDPDRTPSPRSSGQGSAGKHSSR